MFESRHTDEDVLEALRVAAARLPDGWPLKRDAYDALRRPGDLSGGRVISRLGSWTGACARAGVPTNTPRPRRNLADAA